MLSDIKNYIKNSIKYETTCKIRNHHKPISEDLEEFLKNMKNRKETFCVDCDAAIELEQDEDEESYWVREI